MDLRGPTSKGREGNWREGKGRGKGKKRKKGEGREERRGGGKKGRGKVASWLLGDGRLCFLVCAVPLILAHSIGFA